jgi:chemotaxis protein methyltransferase CheR|tara:strand:+ start:8909 stop:9754 length:846 start_codon:yes stop_codon:yes gene_type:complete
MPITNESEDYKQFRAFLENACGILLGDNKAYLVNSRIKSVLQKYELPNLNQLVSKLNGAAQPGLKDDVVDAMTTNETLWFRDNHPFSLLKTKIFPELCGRSSIAPIKIWSSACSTGQEPYSIAITAKEFQDSNPGKMNSGVAITATDISQSVLNMAKEGVYEMLALGRGMSEERLKHCFDQKGEGKWKIKPGYQKAINFKALNLMESFQSIGSGFDIIFCRNVLIYFSPELKKELLIKMHKSLKPGGYLLLGASESLNGLSDYYQMEQCRPGILYRAKSRP